ncbi:MAG: hypothetical protein GXP50_08250 [Deltaproteobacteria bacterium]|nr:hypothetical protein [Deltaproteobacteria bacterium]
MRSYAGMGLALLSALAVMGCGSRSSNGGPSDPAEPAFSAARFGADSAQVTNPYFPLGPGRTWIYTVETEDGTETDVVEVLDETRTVAGVTSRVVHDRVFLDGLLMEDTRDWYAQDSDGNIWYLGEEVTNYEYDDEGGLVGTDDEGAWEAGVGGAEPGILFKAQPVVGDSYRQEFLEGKAEDMARVEAVNVAVELENGTVYEGCVRTLEWNPLEENSDAYKYYCPDVGVVKEELEDLVELRAVFQQGAEGVPDFSAAVFTDPSTVDHPYFPLEPGATWTYTAETEDGVETTVVEVLDETRVVNGIECRVVRDRVYLGDGPPLGGEDLLIEDTHDWYAQDDAGNVWYMGEQVVNYEYDDEGNLLATDSEGAWEAGVNGAMPGYLMPASPAAGMSYYQEFYEDEAEDMAYVVATGIGVELEDAEYTECVQTLDWNPLEPDVLEYKYYCPDVGMVKEEVITDEETVELAGSTLL